MPSNHTKIGAWVLSNRNDRKRFRSLLLDSITLEEKRDLFWSILFDNITPKNNRELFRSLLPDKITPKNYRELNPMLKFNPFSDCTLLSALRT